MIEERRERREDLTRLVVRPRASVLPLGLFACGLHRGAGLRRPP